MFSDHRPVYRGFRSTGAAIQGPHWAAHRHERDERRAGNEGEGFLFEGNLRRSGGRSGVRGAHFGGERRASTMKKMMKDDEKGENDEKVRTDCEERMTDREGGKSQKKRQ